MLKLLRISPSPLSSKKWRAYFSDDTHTDFGAKGYEDFTQHKDPERKRLYRIRHKNDRINDPKTAGCLSWYILWSDINMEKAIAQYKKRFNL